MDYPIIMISDNECRRLVVLFDAPKIGTVLECSDDQYEVAEHLTIWEMDAFKVHDIPVVLSNR